MNSNKSNLLSALLVSGALLAAGQVFADPAAAKTSQDVSLTGGAAAAPASGNEAPVAADTGSTTKSKNHKKKAAAPAVMKPQTDMKSHMPGNR